MRAGVETEAVPVEFAMKPFFSMFPFDRTENIRKPLVFGYFQGHQKGALGRNGILSFSYV